MYQIEEGLYQGGRCGEQHPDTFDVDHLHPSVTAIVSLEDDRILNEAVNVQIFLPIVDGPFPGMVWLQMAVGIVEHLRAAEHIVYIHCRAGISRSVMLTAAYLMKKHRWSMDAAMEWIAKNNPTLNPNRSFMRGLRVWEKYLKGPTITDPDQLEALRDVEV